MQDLHPPFLPSCTFHVYNHANGADNIFREDDNYRFFLEKYQKHICPVADTLAWCLMKNHFHLLVRVKGEIELANTFKVFENFEGLQIAEKVSQRFSNLFNSYTKAFNKKYNRRGSLFIPRVKRKQISNNAYFTSAIIYIHRNPVHHGFVDKLEDWHHSSYWGILKDNDLIVPYAEVKEWFGGKDEFIKAHNRPGRLKSVFD